MLRQASQDPKLANCVVHGEEYEGLGEQERAIIAFARKLTREPWAMEQADLEQLRESGLSEEQVLDVVLAPASRTS